jgi:transposase-like protein
MARRYPPEFRRKVLDLLQAGRTVRQVAFDLQISDQTIYNWREQELIDTAPCSPSPGIGLDRVPDPCQNRRGSTVTHGDSRSLDPP